MPGWYIRRGEKIVGPADLSKLRELVAAGQLLPTDELAKDVTGPWTVASGTKLFAAQPSNLPVASKPPRAPAVIVDDRAPAIEPPTKPSDLIAGTGRNIAKAFGAVSKSLATRAERRHEIKLAKIQAGAIRETKQQLPAKQSAQAPIVMAPQFTQATVVKVVNKNSGGCGSGCGTLLLLLILAAAAVVIIGALSHR